MTTIIYNNRHISGIKPILISLFLLICFSCLFFPIVFSQLIIELEEGATSYGDIAFFGIISFFAFIFIISTLYISLKLIFGKIHIVLNDYEIVVKQYVLGILMASKPFSLTGDTHIVLESGSSASNTNIFRDNGKVQVFQMEPVVYSIKIRGESCFSSGNYSRVLQLFKQITERYPELKSTVDISSAKQLLTAYRKKIHFVKKRVTLSLSIFCVFSAALTALPLYSIYTDYESSRNWVKIRGRVEEASKSKNEEHLCVSYDWKEKKLHTSCYEKKELASRYGENITRGDSVPIYVNPENPKQCTLDTLELSSTMLGIIICFVTSLILSLLSFCLFLRLKSKIKEVL